MRWLLVSMLVIVCLAERGWSREITRSSGVLRKVVTVLAAGIFTVAPLTVAPLHADEDKAWKRVKKSAKGHQASVFYLLIGAGDKGWRIMHTEFVGFNEDDKPLLVGMRAYILSGDGIGRVINGERHVILDLVELSLVGHRGVVAHNVKAEEVASFKHPDNKWYDQTLMVLKNVDLDGYEPIVLATYPPPDTELELFSYYVTEDNFLRFLNYPLRSRKCQALNFDKEDMYVRDTCFAAEDALAVVGAPIFNKVDETLVSFFLGKNRAGDNTGSAILPGLQRYVETGELSVDNQDKIATLWSRIKEESR